ncbi:MAG: hypothetical protein KatS3mg102_1045 [Planctomycetota bacterium]|nr:MAG: hypothetical protein KatS3mg102_1045 [Planctomycetota bacterium]
MFLHQIVPGGADRSYGLHVARLAGVPPEVVARASEVLAELEALRRERQHASPRLAQPPGATAPAAAPAAAVRPARASGCAWHCSSSTSTS